ncbi:hypothetical protein L2755_02260 [Shewanella abyssi]|uniref:hypothetical protein n=1 Tax=Shewanella abyssi TaxID=311789 RepID=UPI00200F8540|nr:hypothetical protein [Shewanella abyssi]MCL1048457.1 hypothetical protein [Shewanella abyssi]
MTKQQKTFALLQSSSVQLKIPLSGVMAAAVTGKTINISNGLNALLSECLPPKKVKTSLTILGHELDVKLDEHVLLRLNEVMENPAFESEDFENAFYELLRYALPYEERPPSIKQIKYAGAIATMLDVDLPSELSGSTEACSDFIDKYQDEFKTTNSRIKAMSRHVRKLAKQGYADFLYRNEHSFVDICSVFDVVKESTVIKYISEYREWAEEFKLYKHESQLQYMDSILYVIEAEYPEFTDFVETMESEKEYID